MANIWEKAKSILAGNLNSGLSYLITTVTEYETAPYFIQLSQNMGLFVDFCVFTCFYHFLHVVIIKLLCVDLQNILDTLAPWKNSPPRTSEYVLWSDFFQILAMSSNGEWYNLVKIQDPYRESRMPWLRLRHWKKCQNRKIPRFSLGQDTTIYWWLF